MSIDMTTAYLKMQLKNPLVVSACPLTGKLDSLLALENAGASAVVLQSLFEEQIEHEELEWVRLHEFAGESNAESLSYLPELEDYNSGPEPYLEFIESAKQALSIPVIASLNGTSPGKWTRYAKLIELAGADALELNIYRVPCSSEQTATQVENDYVEIVASVAEELSIPVAVKIGPFFTALPHFSQRLVKAGASGLVLFNRYLEPEINIETLRVEPHLMLSSRRELRLVLRWLGILRDQMSCSLAATSGIHQPEDVVRALLVGANVTMVASAVLLHKPAHLSKMLSGLYDWMARRDYASVTQLIGSVCRDRSADPAAFERDNYMKSLVAFSSNRDWSNDR